MTVDRSGRLWKTPAWRRIGVLFAIFLGGATGLQALGHPIPTESLYGRTVREIRIQGLQFVQEQVVMAQVASRVGEVYTAETARNDYRSLDRLGMFSAIVMHPAPAGEEVLLVIEVQEMPKVFPHPSIGITGENGTSGGVGIKIPSLWRRGISLSSTARFGPLTEFELLLQTPWKCAPRAWFDARFNYRDRPNELVLFREHAEELDLRGGSKLGLNWRAGGRFAFNSVGSDKPGITLSKDNRDNTPALGALVEYDGRDLRSNPHRGWQATFDVTQNGGWIGGDGNFVTAQIDVRRFQPLARRHVLALFTLVSLQSGVVGVDVPRYRDFRIGGTNTVRGWASNSRRGNNQFLNTLEYRFELMRPRSFRVKRFGFYIGLQLAAFGDLGTAWDRGGDFTGDWIGGGGFGIRFLVPVLDTIRVDFGFGQDGQGLLSHFGLREKADYARMRVR